MKNLLMLLMTCLTIWSCSHQSNHHSNSADTTETKEQLVEQNELAKVQINVSFPFGCAGLTKLQYPKHWKADPDNYGHLEKASGREFENITKCFEAINLSATIKPPQPREVELLEIGDHFKRANNTDTIMQNSFDSCRYRLPDMGIYECYYSYSRYGNLILLDPKTNKGKLLNIYANDLGGESHTLLRYFFIDNNVIHIYDAYCYDDGCSMDESFRLVVTAGGEISINQVKK